MSAVDIFKKELDRRITEWEEIGVVIGGERVPRQMQKQMGEAYKRHITTLHEDRVINQLIKKQAAQLKRPYVTAFKNRSLVSRRDKVELEESWLVTIPKTKRCEILASQLLLAATKKPDGQEWYTYDDVKDGKVVLAGRKTLVPMISMSAKDGIVTTYPPTYKKLTAYRFGIGGDTVYQHWLNRCITDEDYKRALGTLPMEVT